MSTWIVDEARGLSELETRLNALESDGFVVVRKRVTPVERRDLAAYEVLVNTVRQGRSIFAQEADGRGPPGR